MKTIWDRIAFWAITAFFGSVGVGFVLHESRISVLESQFQSVERRLEKIEIKIDRLLERKYP